MSPVTGLGRCAMALASIFCVCVAGGRAGEGPATVDAPALVRQASEVQAWLTIADSLRVRFETTYTHPERWVRSHAAELRSKFPTVDVNEKTFPELRQQSMDKGEIAFDKTRLYRRMDLPDQEELTIDLWNGSRAVQWRRVKQEEMYAFLPRPDLIGSSLQGSLPVLYATPGAFWWRSGRGTPANGNFGRADDFDSVGQITFDGIDCNMLENRSSWVRLYVGTADHRLHGIERRVQRPGSEAQAQRVRVELARKFGAVVTTSDEFGKWRKGLPIALREQVGREEHQRLWDISEPIFTNHFSDYRELAPGSWMPIEQTVDLWSRDDEGLFVGTTIRQRIVSGEVNRALPDELFSLKYHDGAKVFDRTHEPLLLVYRYKAHFTPDEWRRILDEARGRQTRSGMRKVAADEMVGKPAPEFPKGAWLNSSPLRWADLKGKVVVLDFWAVWCGPCMNDLPVAAKLDGQRAKTGIVVIGVHPAGSPVDRIRQVMQQFQMKYPVCIDQPPPGNESLGLMCSQLVVGALPQAFVVDRDGRVAGAGSLDHVIAVARDLAARP